MRLAAMDRELLDRLFHDLKQPLNLIRFVAQDLRLDIANNRLEPGLLSECMQSVEQAVDELTAQINKLRFLTQDRPAGRQTPLVPTAIDNACRAAIERVRSTVSHPLEISESLAANLPVLAVDPLGLEQAVWELLDNGARAALDAPHGRPQLTVQTTLRELQVIVSVEDNGEGVREGDRQRIFEPLFTTRCGAAGLGLALVRAFAGAVGGEVVLLPGHAGGTLFELRLPCTSSKAGNGSREEA